MAQCSKPIIDENWVSISRMRFSIERFGKRRTVSGTRALIGPIICLIPARSLLRAGTMEMNETSSLESGGCSSVGRFAIVRAQAASARISKSALFVQDSRSTSKKDPGVNQAFAPTDASRLDSWKNLEVITQESTYVP